VSSYDYRDFNELLNGTGGNDGINGFGGNDRIFTYGGNDVLFGGTGADQMTGGTGDDAYFVDNGTDQAIEVAGEGYDALYTSVSYTLAAGTSIEWLSADAVFGTGAIDLTGNEIANVVLGNQGINILDGGGGADTLVGYGGNDTYYVDNASDAIVEAAGSGFDVVYASVSYALTGGAEVEWLSTTAAYGTGAINLTGNEYGNVILGNEGANILNGAGGADLLVGYGGNDTYFLDTAADLVAEGAGAGFDAIYTSASYVLGAGVSVEWLSADAAYGTGSINLTGNELTNIILGNAGANVLDGGGAADLIYGYGGADSFAFTTALSGDNVDLIGDFAGGVDKIALDDAIFTALGGALNPNAFVLGTAAAGAEDRIIYNSANGQLFYDADGTGDGAQILFAVLTNHASLSASDFQVI
jgi:Ca2+-binding RTX toxin-like protein